MRTTYHNRDLGTSIYTLVRLAKRHRIFALVMPKTIDFFDLDGGQLLGRWSPRQTPHYSVHGKRHEGTALECLRAIVALDDLYTATPEATERASKNVKQS